MRTRNDRPREGREKSIKGFSCFTKKRSTMMCAYQRACVKGSKNKKMEIKKINRKELRRSPAGQSTYDKVNHNRVIIDNYGDLWDSRGRSNSM